MQDLLLGIWQDLRAKRLVPVAALLLVGIIAVPVLLTKSSAQPAIVEPTAASIKPPAESGVTLDAADAESSATGSSLDVFAAKDPFSPPKSVTAAAKKVASASSASKAGPSDGAAGGNAPSGGGGSEPVAPVPAPQRPTTAEYEYVADVTFWDGNRRRNIKGLRKLDMLPNQSSPALIFMGTTGGGGDAVFLVDSTLSTAGEGRCEPNPGNCAFVYIGPGAEHTFTSESGESYRLRIDEIRKVKTKAAASENGPTASTAVGSDPATEPQRFALPSLVDMVVETTVGSDSSNAENGR
jgi:hypothetical protein